MKDVRLTRRVHRGLVLALLASSAALGGCVGGLDAEPVDVVTTIYPLTFLVEHLAPELTVSQLVGPGQEAHSWEPSVSQVQRVAGAKLVVAQGAQMEPWLDRLTGSLGADAPPIVIATNGIELLAAGGQHGEEGDHELAGADPHTWLDPILLAAQARIVGRALEDAFPEGAAEIANATEALVQDLARLDDGMAGALAECAARVVIVNHDAYSYLGHRYDFSVEAVHGLAPDSEPSPRVVERLVDLAEEHDIGIVFFEELASPRTVQAIARDVGAQTRVLHNLENPEPGLLSVGEDYFSLQRENLASLAEAMRCR